MTLTVWIMQFQVTYIDFDFSSDDPTWGDVDYDTQQEVIEETKGTIWEADDEDDLIEEITSATGWCINSIDYRHILNWNSHYCLMILHPTNSQHFDFNDWLENCPVQWFKLDSDDDQPSYQFIIDTSDDDEEWNSCIKSIDYRHILNWNSSYYELRNYQLSLWSSQGQWV